MTVEVTSVLLDRLVLDKAFQFRTAINDPTVKQYAEAMEAGAEFPPISIAMVNGAAVVVDGWHRVEAARRVGSRTLLANVETMSRNEARLRATMANLKNGLQMKPKERNNALRTALAIYIQGRKHLKGRSGVKSFEEICCDLGNHVNRKTIREWIMRHHPRTYASCWGKEVSPGAGGLQDLPEDTTFVDTVTASLDNALAAFQGIECPEDRSALVAKVERMLDQMRSGERLSPEDPWAGSEPDF